MSCDGIFTLEHTMAHKTGHADKDAFEYEESTHTLVDLQMRALPTSYCFFIHP